MYKKKLCLSTNNTFGITEAEQVRLFKRAGFDGFNVLWGYGLDETVEECARVGEEEGMIFQSIHAPWGYCADMWDEACAEDAEDGVAELCHCLDLCKKYNVPVMVSHVYVGFDEEYVPTDFGIRNYGRVVDYAESLGVKIAFENTEGGEYLEAVLNAFGDRECVGFCWDSGHEMCYNFSENLVAKYGHKLIATHLNDNLGVKDYSGKITWHDDLHLLPYDGMADWDELAERLYKCGYNDILTFELNNKSKPNRHENDKYWNMPIEEYIAECYVRACRFANTLIKKENNG